MEVPDAVQKHRIGLQKPFDVHRLRATLMALRLPQPHQTNQRYPAVTV